jgi:hypothetical protein
MPDCARCGGPASFVGIVDHAGLITALASCAVFECQVCGHQSHVLEEEAHAAECVVPTGLFRACPTDCGCWCHDA